MTAARNPEFEVRLPTQLEMVRPVRRVLEALLSALGWSEDDVADVGLIATEVIQNAVEHGSRNDGREVVAVRCAVVAGELTVDVRDPGTGKGPESLLTRDVTVPPPLESSRGRGLYLVHRMAQAMDRRRTAEGGSAVRVRMTPTAPA
jgi:anti-sigma regulatory factor (Ser/Thr protein kinase)